MSIEKVNTYPLQIVYSFYVNLCDNNVELDQSQVVPSKARRELWKLSQHLSLCFCNCTNHNKDMIKMIESL